ncbi:MAG: hypothetical protein K1W34_01235 [Lachnospiraceae bacterium]
MEIIEMNDKELKDTRLKEFEDLQRIKKASDRDSEVEYQEKILKAQLQALGTPTEELELK